MYLFLLILSLLTVLFSGCGTDSSADSPSRVADLLYVGTDATYASSILFTLDLTEGESTEVLAGQSGDFVLLRDKSLFGFNRTADNLNFREISVEDSNYQLGSQKSLPADMAYDPHAILEEGDTYIIAANYTRGELALIARETGERVYSLGEFSTPKAMPFRPEDLVRRDATTFLVLHQGIAADFGNTAPGAVFLVSVEGETFVAHDQDSVAPGTQGIQLPGHTPVGFFPTSDERVVFVPSFCAAWMGSGCEASLIRLNIDTLATENIAFSGVAQQQIYGGLAYAPSSDSVFLVTGSGTPDADPVLRRLDLTSGTSADIFTFQGRTGMLLFDPASATLYVGESDGDKQGKIHRIREGEDLASFETPAMAVQGLLQ